MTFRLKKLKVICKSGDSIETKADARILNLDRIVGEVKQSEEWEAVEMNILEIGIEQGIGQGIEEGEKRFESLLQFLTEAGRIEDIKRIAFDKEYRKQLYREYNLNIPEQ